MGVLDQILGWAVIWLPIALSVAFIFVPARSEDARQHMRWRYWLVAVAVLLGALSWWQQSRAIRASGKGREEAIKETSKEVAAETSKQVTKTVTEQYSQMVAEQKRQITELENQLNAQAKDVRAIKGSNIVTGKNPIKVEVTNDNRITPPVLTGIRIASQKRIPSDDAKLPYGLEVVVQTDADIEPVAVAVVCDGVIGRGSAGFSHVGMYTMSKEGLAEGHENVFMAEWKSPAWTPQEPIVVRLFSQRPIKATSVVRQNYVWP